MRSLTSLQNTQLIPGTTKISNNYYDESVEVSDGDEIQSHNSTFGGMSNVQTGFREMVQNRILTAACLQTINLEETLHRPILPIRKMTMTADTTIRLELPFCRGAPSGLHSNA